MNKLLLGLSILLSVVLLSGCGSGSKGSAGADGATGATGETGATGASGSSGGLTSLTPFSDSDLLILYNGAAGAVPGSTPTAVPLDTGAAVGKLSGTLTIANADNITAISSSSRYYLYEEDTSGISKSMALQTSNATYVENQGPLASQFWTANTDDGEIDTRHLTSSDNITITLADWVLQSGIAGSSYTTSSFNVCPGDISGDGTCSKVKAPAYDRGIHTVSPMSSGKNRADLAASIAYAGGSFHVLADNGTGASDATGDTDAAAYGMRFSVAKTGYATALTSDNTSGEFHSAQEGAGQEGGLDNQTKVSNILTRGSNVWFAMSYDNSSIHTTTGRTGPGDNVSLAYRSNGTGSFTDNGTIAGNLTELSTAPQIANGGDGVYIMLGASTTVTNYIANDNGTVESLGAATVGTADTWCSTSTGTASEYAVIVSDNSTASGGAGIMVSKVYDNGTTTAITYVAGTGTEGHVNMELCAVTHLGGTFYVAVTDETGSADNVSVWKSTTLTSWTQIGEDFTITGDAAGIAIGTTGTTASDNAVWVAVNDAGTVELLHYEDIAGGSTYAWRSLGTLISSATTSGAAAGVSIATDGSNSIAVSAIVSGQTTAGIWYNQ